MLMFGLCIVSLDHISVGTRGLLDINLTVHRFCDYLTFGNLVSNIGFHCLEFWILILGD